MYSPQQKFKANLLTQYWQINLKYCLKAPGFKVYKISFRVQTKKKNKAYQILCDFFKNVQVIHLTTSRIKSLPTMLRQPRERCHLWNSARRETMWISSQHELAFLPISYQQGIFMSTAITLKAECHNDSPSGKELQHYCGLIFPWNILLTTAVLYLSSLDKQSWNLLITFNPT